MRQFKSLAPCGRGAGVRGNKAFTLAEVLITLVIIGVIGALTVPALIQNTQKQEYVSALKKAYSTLSQASQQIIAEEGSPRCDEGGWACNYDSIHAAYKKHLNIAKECKNNKECFAPKYTELSPGRTETYNGFSNGFVLTDGSSITFGNITEDCTSGYWGNEPYCARIFVDVNGHKAPNKIGIDLFDFVIKESGLKPSGCDGPDYWCHSTWTNHGGVGFGCACKALREGAMNY